MPYRDPAKAQEYRRQYYLKNRDKLIAWQRNHRTTPGYKKKLRFTMQAGVKLLRNIAENVGSVVREELREYELRRSKSPARIASKKKQNYIARISYW